MNSPVFAKCSFDGKVLFAEEFGDIYFSVDDAPAESLHVFVNGNDLPQKFAAANLRDFMILETGFGTGLNFMQAGKTFLQLAPAAATLKFISIEKYPIHPDLLAEIFACWPDDFGGLKNELLQKYSPSNDVLRISLADGRILLEVHFADVLEALDEIDTPTDAIFLDGFAPDKNEHMWDERVMMKLASLSKPGRTTVASFTAAGCVKTPLRAAGFFIKRREGFGRKRHMITGFYQNQDLCE